MKEKKWITLNQHGKWCLRMWVMALSANDVTSTAMFYLLDKGILDGKENFKDSKDRVELAGKCLTDAGLETVKHYIPNYFRKGEV